MRTFRFQLCLRSLLLVLLALSPVSQAEQRLGTNGASASASVRFKIVIPAQIVMSANEAGEAQFVSNLPDLQIVVDEYSLAELGSAPGLLTAARP